MTTAELTRAALKLSPAERLEHVSKVWNSLADATIFEPTPELRAMLEERLAEAQRNPDAGRSWTNLQAELRADLAERKTRTDK